MYFYFHWKYYLFLFLFSSASRLADSTWFQLNWCCGYNSLLLPATMIIFKDLITGDEMFTDSSKYKLIDECLYEVECRHVQRKQGDITLEGSNPSQEEADEGTDECVQSGLDLVLNQRLIETGFTKHDYKNYLKTYTKSLQDKWKEMGTNDNDIAEAKSKITEAVKKVLPKLGDMQFFMGESSNPDGLIALLEYRENPSGGETPIMIFFKHGLDEEKV